MQANKGKADEKSTIIRFRLLFFITFVPHHQDEQGQMILSILIPTYNYDCSQLVLSLHKEMQEIGTEIEILVADDASTEQFKEKNRCINKLSGCHYLEMTENLGRSRIRNYLADKAQGKYILFMDCDAKVNRPDFIRQYIYAANQAPVACGGLRHPDWQPSPEVSLRYRYEKEADKHRSAEERKLKPYDCFATFCFLIERELFHTIRFNEHCTEYGYEDTLFGEELKKRNVSICHFENPLIHLGLEPNAVYLQKSETALRMLVNLQRQGIEIHSRIGSTYARIKRWHLHHLLPLIFNLTAPLLRNNLLGRKPNLYLFAYYKLSFYACLLQQK